ncbi:MAG: 4Fe-4S binding protein [Candidatus Omnitrophica bacterium]|nr:4Fe-4S binding protein [Candidatus Omnitrophota bacterium]
MSKKAASLFLWALFIVTLCYCHVTVRQSSGPPLLIDRDLAVGLFPGDCTVTRVEYSEKKIPHFTVFGLYRRLASEEILGYAVITTQLVPGERGYEGPIQVALGINRAGSVTGARILRHRETASYAMAIESDWFLGQFTGKTPDDPLILGGDIDGITGATVSAGCVARSIKKSIALVNRELLGKTGETFPETVKKPLSFFAYLLHPLTKLAVLILLIFLALYDYVLQRKLRYVILCISVVYFGFLAGEFLSLSHLRTLLTLELPVFAYTYFWFFYTGFIIILTGFYGRVYCGYLCPFGALQEIVYAAVPNTKLIIPRRIDRRLKYIKYSLLAVILSASFVIPTVDLSRYEPFVTGFRLRGGILDWVLVSSVLAIGVFVIRFWCRYFCPTGAALALLSRFSVFSLRMEQTNCSRCGACGLACETACIDGEGIKNSECIRCNECRRVCRKAGIHISRRKERGRTHAI